MEIEIVLFLEFNFFIVSMTRFHWTHRSSDCNLALVGFLCNLEVQYIFGEFYYIDFKIKINFQKWYIIGYSFIYKIKFFFQKWCIIWCNLSTDLIAFIYVAVMLIILFRHSSLIKSWTKVDKSNITAGLINWDNINFIMWLFHLFSGSFISHS